VHRKLLNPMFSPTLLKSLVSRFNEHTNIFISYLKKNAGKELNISNEITKLTMDIICDLGFGYKLNATIDESTNDVAKAFRKLLAATSNPLNVVPYGSQLLAIYYRKHINAINKVIYKSIENGKQHATEPNTWNLLSFMLSDHNQNGNFSDLAIRDELASFFLAGNETTAVTLTWTIYELARNPEILKKVREEIALIIGDREDITNDDLQQFKYMTNVLKESLRLYIPAPVLIRSNPEACEIEGYKIPKNCQFFVSLLSNHLAEDLYPNARAFIPERWNDSSLNKHPLAYAPFSLGARNCIGQNFFLA